jgi:hypothetical protein
MGTIVTIRPSAMGAQMRQKEWIMSGPMRTVAIANATSRGPSGSSPPDG